MNANIKWPKWVGRKRLFGFWSAALRRAGNGIKCEKEVRRGARLGRFKALAFEREEVCGKWRNGICIRQSRPPPHAYAFWWKKTSSHCTGKLLYTVYVVYSICMYIIFLVLLDICGTVSRGPFDNCDKSIELCRKKNTCIYCTTILYLRHSNQIIRSIWRYYTTYSLSYLCIFVILTVHVWFFILLNFIIICVYTRLKI